MSALAPMPGPGPSQAGPPPALLAAIAGAAAHGVPHQIQVTPPGQSPPSQTGRGNGGSFSSAVQQAISDLHQVAQMTDDHQDAADVEKCISVLRGILATEQKERDQAMGGKLSPRVMRKAY